MTVYLDTDQITVWRPTGDLDTHGWAVDGDPTALAIESGSIQVDPRPVVELAAQGRDHGPADPYALRTATGYLQVETIAVLGDILVTGSGSWRVLSLSPAPDPTGGGAGCVVAQLRGQPT